MEELTAEDLLRKAEEARRRCGMTVQERRAVLVGDVGAGIVPSAPPPSRPGDSLLTPDEIQRRREELARRFPPPPRVVRPPAVPERYRHARWATWEKKGPEIETAKEAVRLWVRGVVEGKHMMVALVGPKGTGKSHMLACAAWELYEEHGIRAGFYEWFMVAPKLRNLNTAEETRLELQRARPLILDECRPTSATDFDATELALISMYAYSHLQSVLLATNWASLEELMGEPAADRYTIVPVIGPSAR